jgi:hypothetical protein
MMTVISLPLSTWKGPVISKIAITMQCKNRLSEEQPQRHPNFFRDISLQMALFQIVMIYPIRTFSY